MIGRFVEKTEGVVINFNIRLSYEKLSGVDEIYQISNSIMYIPIRGRSRLRSCVVKQTCFDPVDLHFKNGGAEVAINLIF